MRTVSEQSMAWEKLAHTAKSDLPIQVRAGSWRTARELALSALVVAVALGASSLLGSCQKHESNTPDISDPFPPPEPLVLRAIAMDDAGHLVGVYGELRR